MLLSLDFYILQHRPRILNCGWVTDLQILYKQKLAVNISEELFYMKSRGMLIFNSLWFVPQ